MQSKYLLKKKEFYFSFKSFADSHYGFASTAGGSLLRNKPMNQPLNGVAGIPQTHVWNLWSWISPVIELVRPWYLRIRVSYIPNYKTAISDKITGWEVEQFPLTLAGPGGRFSPPPANICDNSRTLRDRKAKLSVPFPTSILHLMN